MADILTVAAALAAEVEERPWATLVPHVLPGRASPGFPPYSWAPCRRARRVGERAVARRCGRCSSSGRGARPARAERRARAGGAAAARPRARRHLARSSRWWPPSRSSSTRAASPMPGLQRDRAAAVGAALRRGRAAARRRPARAGGALARRRTPSTGCCAPRSRASPTEPVRVLATWNRRRPPRPLPDPPNARLVEWVSYARTMPRCAAVVCHAGHGTWPGRWPAGCRWWHARTPATRPRTPPRCAGPASACRCRAASTPRAASGWRCGGCWPSPGYARRARAIGDWCERTDGAATAASPVEARSRDGHVDVSVAGTADPTMDV